MCSTLAPTTAVAPALSPAQEMAALVAAQTAGAARMAELVSGGVLTTVPVSVATEWTEQLLRAGDRVTAVGTVGVGVVDAATTLIDGRYVSPARWIETCTRTSGSQAAALARLGRDLVGPYSPVATAWLAGSISRAGARELTVEVRQVLRAAPSSQRASERTRILAALVPVAERATVADLHRAVTGIRFALDPDGTSQAALDAYDEQTLTVAVTGQAAHISIWTTPETAAAVLTVLDQQVSSWFREGTLPAEEPVDHDPDTGEARPARYRRSHLLALAFGDTMRGLLDRGLVGTHHGVAPHVTVTVDADRLVAGLGGDLHLAGHDDPVPLPAETVRRILCDATLTPVVTAGAAGCPRSTDLTDLLTDAARTVLYVGRAERTVPPRLRRALEARDRHCAFRDCRVSVQRCHAHHVVEWQHGGGTDLDNLVLLCSRHHHVVHEAGWTITPAGGGDPATTGYWAFDPPRPRP